MFDQNENCPFRSFRLQNFVSNFEFGIKFVLSQWLLSVIYHKKLKCNRNATNTGSAHIYILFWMNANIFLNRYLLVPFRYLSVPPFRCPNLSHFLLSESENRVGMAEKQLRLFLRINVVSVFFMFWGKCMGNTASRHRHKWWRKSIKNISKQ